MFLTLHSISFAWSTVNGITICTAATSQVDSFITSDGAGEAIITWEDYRNTTANVNQGADIYAQRVDTNGNILWSTNGVAICTAVNDQYFYTIQYSPIIISDGSGGAIITWQDYRNTTGNVNQGTDIYAQRVNSQGSTLWTLNGLVICTALYDQRNPTLVSDNAGGVILTWVDSRGGSNNINDDIYAQRINSQGSTLWATNGIAISTAANIQFNETIVSDSSGGAIIVWRDDRTGSTNHVYAQRVNDQGSTLWLTNGVSICTASGAQNFPTSISDGFGGAIVTWNDSRSGTSDIYSQRVNSQGSTLWTTNGVPICMAVNNQFIPNIISDNAGGAVITWLDVRSGINSNIYSQRVNSQGSTLWTLDGVAVCTAGGGSQESPVLVDDGSGGAVITWYDGRSGTDYDIYSQRVNSQGSTLWTPNGVALCTATGYQFNPQLISTGNGGAIVTWFDIRNGSNFDNYDIYAQQVNGNGLVPVEDWWKY